eukprot:scaffold84368_cov30-Tisochrysis_lutea.AAC.1
MQTLAASSNGSTPEYSEQRARPKALATHLAAAAARRHARAIITCSQGSGVFRGLPEGQPGTSGGSGGCGSAPGPPTSPKLASLAMAMGDEA